MKLSERIWKFWAARSLMIGVASTTLDLTTGALVLWLGGGTRFAAMSGTTLGSTFTYFASRHFAFKDHREPVAKSGLKFFLVQAVLGIAHGQVTVWLREWHSKANQNFRGKAWRVCLFLGEPDIAAMLVVARQPQFDWIGFDHVG